MSNSAHDAVLAAGASSSTGATFADRLALCGYDLVQVPRYKDQLETNASRLRGKAGVALEIVRDGLTVAEGPARLESRQLRGESTGLFTDSAGAPVPGRFVDLGKNTLRPVFARERKQPILWRI